MLVGGRGRLPRLPFLHVVGRGTLTKDAPLSAYFGSRGAERPPLLLAEGALALGSAPLPDAELIARTYGWVLPIAPGSLHDWEIPGLARRVDARRFASRRSIPSSASRRRSTRSRSVHAKARVAGERLLLIGGDVAVLLLAFAVLAAARRRRDTDDARRRLTWSGARWSQLATFTAVEPALVAFVAVCVGWAAGAGFAALLARSLSTDAGPGACAFAALGPWACTRRRARRRLRRRRRRFAPRERRVVRRLVADDRGRRGGRRDRGGIARRRARRCERRLGRRRQRGVPVAASGARRLRRGGARGAAARAGAFVCSVARTGRCRCGSPRVSLARRGGTAIVASAFLVVSVGVALFAVSYRATLERGQRDQAAFAVPADYVLSESLERLVPIQAIAPEAFARLGDTVDRRARGGRRARPRRHAARAAGGRGTAPRTAGARDRRSQLGPSEQLRGLDLRSRRFALPFVLHGGPVVLTLDVLKPRGDFAAVELGTATPGTHVLHANVPTAAASSRYGSAIRRSPRSSRGTARAARRCPSRTPRAAC